MFNIISLNSGNSQMDQKNQRKNKDNCNNNWIEISSIINIISRSNNCNMDNQGFKINKIKKVTMIFYNEIIKRILKKNAAENFWIILCVLNVVFLEFLKSYKTKLSSALNEGSIMVEFLLLCRMEWQLYLKSLIFVNIML